MGSATKFSTLPLKTEKNVEDLAQTSLLQKGFEFAHVLVVSSLASDFERDFFHALKQTLLRQIFRENSKIPTSISVFYFQFELKLVSNFAL